MKIEKIKLNDIIPTDYNPRTITNEEIIKLQNSINTFGMVDPIIINLKNNHIIGGHQRYNVLQDQYIQNNEFDVELNLIRLGDVGWVFTDTDLTVESDDYEKALNIALNKISGEFDNTKLNKILEDIDFDINKLGLSITSSNENDVMYANHHNERILLDYQIIRFGNYEFKIKNETIEEWEEKLIEESDGLNITPEELLLERLEF